MIVYLDLDDYGTETNTPGVTAALGELVDYFPSFKINMFAPASWLTGMVIPDYVNICMHGVFHTHDEEVANSTLKEWKYTRVYRAPYWQLSDKMYERLIDNGFRVMLNPEVLDYRDGIRFNWNIKDTPNLESLVLMGHGHVGNVCGNGLEESLDRIKMLPRDTEFRFLKDYGRKINNQ